VGCLQRIATQYQAQGLQFSNVCCGPSPVIHSVYSCIEALHANTVFRPSPSDAVTHTHTNPNAPHAYPTHLVIYISYAACCPAVASQVHGFLSNPTSQAQSYWFLGTAALGTALLLLTMPRQVATIMLNGHPDGVVETLVRAAGASLVSTAAVKYTLKVRREGGREGGGHDLVCVARCVVSACSYCYA
jgi:hypothetical protein